MTRRYACFADADCFVCEDLVELGHGFDALRIIDAWGVAKGMKQVVPERKAPDE